MPRAQLVNPISMAMRSSFPLLERTSDTADRFALPEQRPSSLACPRGFCTVSLVRVMPAVMTKIPPCQSKTKHPMAQFLSGEERRVSALFGA